jgi:hypothetical protein
MAHYILQTIAFQVLFLLIYDVFLKKETFFNWNRMYLMATAILSIALPFIKNDNFKSVVPQNYIISLPEIVLSQTEPDKTGPILLDAVIIDNSISYWQIAFYLGITIAVLRFLFKFTKIVILIFKNPKIKSGKLTLVKVLNSNTAFSFFRYVFLGEYLKPEEKEAILKHEIIHVKHIHSLDLLFFELLRILFWFNPLLYMYQNRITTLHEYIADSEAVKHDCKNQYYQNLLSQVFETKNISFINPFFKQSLIKKRIIMLQKSKSKQIKLFKYLLLIPVVCGILVYTSCNARRVEANNQEQSLEAQINQLNSAIVAKRGNTSEGEKQALNSLAEEISKVKYANKGEIPFGKIDQIPILPECKGLTDKEQKSCVVKNISNYATRNFNLKVANGLDLKGEQRINVMFRINTDGKAVDVRSRAKHPELQVEAIRVIKSLPKFEPGIHNGQPVNVLYSFPILVQF